MMWGWNGGWGWGGVVVSILMLLFWAAIIVGIVLVVRSLASSQASGAGQDAQARRSTALDVLEERYARGEIDREEFVRRRDDLLSRPGG